MFRKILVANRGEIALRIICACKELGIPTVAVYSQPDQHSLPVRFADEAVCIGPARSSDSYLNIPAVISAAEISNADAIHPGYGFLAESSYFAEVCEACGLTFIGPAPKVIRLMGEKEKAREAMKEAGLPILPGSGLIRGDTPNISALADEIGYPLILKASAGGGGKGMRIVNSPSELNAAIETARSESQAAFGSSELYLEKYLRLARHIEFQMLADHHGNVVHLGERECSIQRRYQKLLEESPSPFLTAELRNEVGHRAVEALRNVHYTNAGTLEFLFDGQGNYYFMEMNTRIQVEHPVTEMVTSFDIVKEQIRVASGEPVSFQGDGRRLRGHAIECRINAEDPYRNFQPSPGLITAYHPPGGPGVRLDTHVYAGYTVPPYYDSLLAKVIVHGNTREEALSRMGQALDSFILEGVTTTIPFLARVIRHPDFVSGKVDTRFLERESHLLRPEA